MAGIDLRLVEAWSRAGRGLGVRVVAPYIFHGAKGQVAECEAFLPDFGSPKGAVVVSKRTERRERAILRSAPGLWYSIASEHGLDADIRALEDWGWFGESGQEPHWFRKSK